MALTIDTVWNGEMRKSLISVAFVVGREGFEPSTS